MQSMPCLTILQISDLHILPHPEQTLLGIETEHYFNAILDQAFATEQHFDLILVTGDLTQDPCQSSYERILKALTARNIPAICLPGNHDDLTLMQNTFNTDLVSCQKQVIFKSWQLICLNSQIINSPNGNLAAQELEMLESYLIKYPDLNTIIAVHHHCVKTESAWLDTMMIKNSDTFLSLVTKYPKVKVIINGHVHQEQDNNLSNIRILSTPSTCFQFKPLCKNFSVEPAAPGYRVIQLFKDGQLETKVFRLPAPLSEIEFSNTGY
jgi:Icc protein